MCVESYLRWPRQCCANAGHTQQAASSATLPKYDWQKVQATVSAVCALDFRHEVLCSACTATAASSLFIAACEIERQRLDLDTMALQSGLPKGMSPGVKESGAKVRAGS